MKNILRNKHFYVMLGLDTALVIGSFYLAYLIRFEFLIPKIYLNNLERILPFVLLVKVCCFFLFNVYRGMWRYTSLSDLVNVAKAVFTSSLLIVLGVLMVHHFSGYPRSVFIIDGFLTFLCIGGIRVLIRIYFAKKTGTDTFPSLISASQERKNILIIGAGDAGEKTLRELKDNPGLPYRVLGFIDDDPQKKGRAIHDVSVLGGMESLAKVVKSKEVEEILIAVPSATGPQMRRIVEFCESCAVPYKTLPGMGELINGKVNVKALRDVNYQDLLGRQPVSLDLKGIRGYLKNSRVLVTGAGGSIGSELCRQIARFEPELLILLDLSFANLYAIQMELKHRIGYLNYVTVLGRVQNEKVMDQLFGRYQPNVVFHAAAYKHVPMLERNPWQAVLNNIIGTHMVMEQSVHYKTEYFVLVSTDKAVRPANVMGASKRVCEMLLQSFSGNNTRMMAVRFGNVVGSSGSVIPLFHKQIIHGGPVTVTHPNITRYFMTVAEACQLILQAGALGRGGEVFVLDMGTPIRIADMARDLIRLSGKEPDRDVEIVFTGLRPGEKLHEELITEGEGIVPTSHENILVLKPNGSWNGLDTQKAFQRWLLKGIKDLRRLAEKHDADGLREKLQDLVPDYYSQKTDSVL